MSRKPRKKKFRRPLGTTANPNWAYATRPEDLIPRTEDPENEGARMLEIASLFSMTQGPKAGHHFGDVILPWQRDLITYIFGEVDEDDHRHVNRVLLKMGKGSGKSVFAAVIALAVVMDFALRGINHRSLVMIISATVATADIVFQHVFESVRADDELARQFKSNVAKRQMTHVESGIVIEIAPAKLDAAVGRRPILLLVDELHLCALECRQFGQVIDQARRGGQNWGPDYLELMISTAPPERATGVWSETLSYARQVRDGEITDPSFLPVLFEWPLARDDLDMEDPDEWWRGMPSCSTDGTMDPRELRREFEQAHKTQNARELASLLSQRLGIEPGEGIGAGQTTLQREWATAAEPVDAKAVAAVVALDPGGVSDPFAVSHGWMDDDGALCFRCYQWLTRYGYNEPPDFLKQLYDKAIMAGELILCDSVDDLDKKVIEHVRQAYRDNMPMIGGDRHGRGGFVPRLEQEVLGEGNFEEVRQGWQLLRAHDALEAAALDQRLRVVHTPLLDINVENLKLEDGPSGRRFSKYDAGLSGSGNLKIDGIMAVLSAVELLLERRSLIGDDIGWMIA